MIEHATKGITLIAVMARGARGIRSFEGATIACSDTFSVDSCEYERAATAILVPFLYPYMTDNGRREVKDRPRWMQLDLNPNFGRMGLDCPLTGLLRSVLYLKQDLADRGHVVRRDMGKGLVKTGQKKCAQKTTKFRKCSQNLKQVSPFIAMASKYAHVIGALLLLLVVSSTLAIEKVCAKVEAYAVEDFPCD